MLSNMQKQKNRQWIFFIQWCWYFLKIKNDLIFFIIKIEEERMIKGHSNIWNKYGGWKLNSINIANGIIENPKIKI